MATSTDWLTAAEAGVGAVFANAASQAAPAPTAASIPAAPGTVPAGTAAIPVAGSDTIFGLPTIVVIGGAGVLVLILVLILILKK